MANTPNRNYPLVAGGNQLQNDVLKLIALAGMIDADVQSLFNALSGKADLAGAAFTTSPTGPTPAAGDDSNKLATTAFVKAATALAIANLVGSSPAALDTLNELASALGNDPNFAATMITQLGLKANSADLATYATKTGAEELLNKTLTTPVLKLKNSAGAAPTVLGELQWDSATGRLKVGNGSATKEHAANTCELIEDMDVTSIPAYTKTGLAGFKTLKMTFNLAPDATAAAFNVQMSTDNGVSWIGSSSYYRQEMYGSTSVGSLTEATTYWPLTSNNSVIVGAHGIFSELLIDQFNKPKWAKAILAGGYQVTSSGQLVVNGALLGLALTTPRNAIRIVSGSNFSGNIRLEGIRG